MRVLIGLSLLVILGCQGFRRAGEPVQRSGDEISVAGRLFHTGTRVVLWNDAGGYDAYRAHCHFDPERAAPRGRQDSILRYDSFRRDLPAELAARVRARGWELEELRGVITQVVVHYDVAGTSRRCFEVLHDLRGLSCHFLLDQDGTIYQTLDLKERAWHAGHSNDRSVGIEIAHIGAYPTADDATLQAWYSVDEHGPWVTPPEAVGASGLPPGFVPRPCRPQLVRGTVQGTELYQYDFTAEQYSALEKLLVTLCRVLDIEPTVPREADGRVCNEELDEEQKRSFRGILGHYHVSREKIDPGPAFDWDRIERALRRAVR